MIIKLLLDLIFGLVGFIISLLPGVDLRTIDTGQDNAMYLISLGLKFFPVDLWTALLSNIVTWVVIWTTWAIIEWVYKKIPGIK